MYAKLIVLLLLLVQSICSFADTWGRPKIARFFSENKHYMLIVHPTKILENTKNLDKALINPSCLDTTKILCHAILYRIDKNDTIQIWNKRLINHVSPGLVIVANNGKSIVTFDNWYYYADGIDAMVIYGHNGDLVQRFNLADFSPFPLTEYERSISMLFWRCGVKYLNNHEIEICFIKDENITKTRRYNLTTQSFE